MCNNRSALYLNDNFTTFYLAALLGSLPSGLPNTVGSVGSSPQGTSSNSNPIDPSSMQRAYAALGLPYGNQPQAQSQPQVQGQQTAQSQVHQSMRPNPLGKYAVIPQHKDIR